MKNAKFIKFNSWKAFWNAYFDKENLELNDFLELCSYCDPICTFADYWLKANEIFNLYNSNDNIEVEYTDPEPFANSIDIIIKSNNEKYIVPSCPPDQDSFYMIH